MPRILECARCGAGIGHNDTQCWRCGEPVKGESSGGARLNALSMGKTPGPGIRDLRTSKNKEIPKVGPAVRPILETYNGREKELKDREKEVKETMAALEAESRELESTAREMEKERMALKEARERIAQREQELDAKAILLEDILTVTQDIKNDSPAIISSDDKEVLQTAQTELCTVLGEERERIRREVEREMADQLTRIQQLEAELKVARSHLNREMDPVVPVDISQVLSDIRSEMSSQIGAGMPEGIEDTLVRTYVEKLDQILAGGVPQGSVVLINGPPGSMKTSLAFNILHNAATNGPMKGMFLSLEQDSASLLRQMARLDMKREESLENLMVVDLVDLRRSMEGQIGDWRNLIDQYIEDAVTAHGIRLLVLDSLESFAALSENELARSDIQDLFDHFRALGLTTFVISETPMSKLERDGRMELYVADGALELSLKETPDSHVQRWLRCVKMRGTNMDPRYYNMMHAGGAFILSVPMNRYCSE
ncbi:MAG: ATPase domain-containing protein [Methanomassiliicoccus sp.]|nr:ATPase domain-containing protein [Methanomassiliicoccus sp.]